MCARVCVCGVISHSVESDSFVTPCTVALQAPLSMGFPRLKNTGVGCHTLLLGIFPIQGLTLHLLHCRQILHHLSHQGSPTLWQHHSFLECYHSGNWGKKTCDPAGLFLTTALGQTSFPGGSAVKNPPANAGDAGSIPGSGRSPGGGNGNPVQYLAWRIPWTEESGGL